VLRRGHTVYRAVNDDTLPIEDAVDLVDFECDPGYVTQRRLTAMRGGRAAAARAPAVDAGGLVRVVEGRREDDGRERVGKANCRDDDAARLRSAADPPPAKASDARGRWIDEEQSRALSSTANTMASTGTGSQGDDGVSGASRISTAAGTTSGPCTLEDAVDLRQMVEIVPGFERDEVSDGLASASLVDAMALVPPAARHGEQQP
jgi:hypothetical protein